MAHTHLTAEMQECIQNCLDCHRICLESVTHCLKMGGKHAAPEHIRMLLDCAGICQSSADFMLRGSEHHHDVCGVCATVCEACAKDCERLSDDELMRECAAICRRCAESCRQMASAGTRA
jgi:hypothetical protein